jgi:pyruvate/2-oxoglutarate dehydrogenase complex dihydrolipoamide acyltransferase (E2) component
MTVRLPDLGAEGVVLIVWFAEPGEEVYEGDRLVEVRLGPATFDVGAPVSGRLVLRHAAVGAELRPGDPLAEIDPAPDES